MEETQSSVRPKDIWKGAKVLAIAIVTGALVFVLVALVINQVYGPFKPEWKEYRTWQGVVFFLLCGGALVIGKKGMLQKTNKAVNEGGSLVARLQLYMQGLTKYLAACELPVAIGCILFLLTGEFVFMAFSAVMIGNMLAQLPLKRRIAEMLQLNEAELMEIEK
ncbi:MAG: hypothetical protein KA821_18910 [Chitinophagaceae bacterium]|nr:hypothetical protein [Chitinophagaceae bacterium]